MRTWMNGKRGTSVWAQFQVWNVYGMDLMGAGRHPEDAERLAVAAYLRRLRALLRADIERLVVDGVAVRPPTLVFGRGPLLTGVPHRALSGACAALAVGWIATGRWWVGALAGAGVAGWLAARPVRGVAEVVAELDARAAESASVAAGAIRAAQAEEDGFEERLEWHRRARGSSEGAR